MMRIAICATNNNHSYGGGRYHALIIGYALAKQGYDVNFISNKRPVFINDLDPIHPEAIDYHLTPDFRKNMPSGKFDYVILVPTGIFQPDFYEAVFDFTGSANARMALINFESANWFNAMAPKKRDVRLWDYWRRSIFGGGLVISSTETSDQYARDFYSETDDQIRFEVAPPPFNSHACKKAIAEERDNSLIAFVRTSDVHKGGADILNMDNGIFEERALRLISGGDFDQTYIKSLQNKFSKINGATLETYSRVSDEEKYRLLKKSKVLIFPTRFEGFGYPPVEAAACGTQIACYDLPVLKENVGNVANFANKGDVDSLSEAVKKAISQPVKLSLLQSSAENYFTVEKAGQKLSEALCRGFGDIPQRNPRQENSVMSWGPYSNNDAERLDGSENELFPAQVRYMQRISNTNWIAKFIFRSQCKEVSLAPRDKDISILHPLVELLSSEKELREYAITCVLNLPNFNLQKPVELILSDKNSARLQSIQFKLPNVSASNSQFNLKIDEIGTNKIKGTLFEQGKVCQSNVQLILKSNKTNNWHYVKVLNGAFDVNLVGNSNLVDGLAIYIVHENFPVDVATGLPLKFRNFAELETDSNFAKPEFRIANLTNEKWYRGISRTDDKYHGSRVILHKGQKYQNLLEGNSVTIGPYENLKFVEVKQTDGFDAINLKKCISPFQVGFPNTVQPGPGSAQDLKVDKNLNDENWNYGVWKQDGDLKNKGIAFTNFGLQRPLTVGTSIFIGKDHRYLGKVAGSNISNKHVFVWLDTEVDDTQLTQAHDTSIHISAYSSNVLCSTISFNNDDTDKHQANKDNSTRVLYLQTIASDNQLGQKILFSSGTIRQIIDISEDTSNSSKVVLDRKITPAFDLKINQGVTLLDNNSSDQRSLYKYPSSLPKKDNYSSTILLHEHTLPVQISDIDNHLPTNNTSNRRILLLSSVSPLPADQGNRVVTYNILKHLISLGFCVDMVVANYVPADMLQADFGDRVRCYTVPFPDWESSTQILARNEILNAADLSGLPDATIDQLKKSARSFHPYFIVQDAFIRTAADLFRNHQYDSIVCNYTHMLRAAEELQDIRELPPLAVFTHDALSRLPTVFQGKEIDTGFRLCSPEVERDVLNSINKAVVVAISKSEVNYFNKIGVKNPVILSENDAFEECYSFRSSDASYDSQTLVFAGSANPMNLASLDWFYENCWKKIKARLPGVSLHIIGGICKVWNTKSDGVHLLGALSREQMLSRVSGATIAINPTVAGTGLKIKTVEAASLGVPSVCLPLAVEGLEDRANSIGALAKNEEQFIEACCQLLESRDAWNKKRASALNTAKSYFSQDAVFKTLNKAMNWEDEIHGDKVDSLVETISSSALYELEIIKKISDPDAKVAALDQLAQSQINNVEILVSLSEGYLQIHLYSNALDVALKVLNIDRENHSAWQVFVKAIEAMHGKSAGLRAANEAALATSRPTSSFLAEEIPFADISMNFNDRFYIKTLTPDHKIGIGWGEIEKYGIWSISGYSRLQTNVRTKPGFAIKNIELGLATKSDGVDEKQSCRVFANGFNLGNVSIPRDDNTHRIILNLPAPIECPTDHPPKVKLEFFHKNPAPPRKPDGVVTDLRKLGLRLVTIRLF